MQLRTLILPAAIVAVVILAIATLVWGDESTVRIGELCCLGGEGTPTQVCSAYP